MKSKLVISLMMLLVLGFQINPSLGQEYTNDPEIVDIRVRVTDVNMSLSEYHSSVDNGTYINFKIEFELWNPYNVGLKRGFQGVAAYYNLLANGYTKSWRTGNNVVSTGWGYINALPFLRGFIKFLKVIFA